MKEECKFSVQLKHSDNKGKNFEVLFFSNGEKCDTTEINISGSELAQVYLDYFLIKTDLFFLLKRVEDLKIKVLEFEATQTKKGEKYGIINDKFPEASIDELFLMTAGILVIYGRIFSGSSMRKIKLNKIIEKNKIHNSIHKELLNIRNRYIAHTVDRGHIDPMLFLVFNPKDRKKFDIQPYIVATKIFGSEFINEFIELLNFLLEHTSKMEKNKKTELIKEYQHNFNNS